MNTDRHQRLRFSEVTALMLVAVTLAITLIRLANDDPVQMARRVAEMSRSEAAAQLTWAVGLEDPK